MPAKSGLTKTNALTPSELRALLATTDELAVIDTRVHDDYADGHLMVASNAPLETLAEAIGPLVPRNETTLVISDGEARAAAVLASLGYTDIRILDGGIDAWRAAGGELFSGQYVASKALGELVETSCHTPSMDVTEVQRRLATQMVSQRLADHPRAEPAARGLGHRRAAALVPVDLQRAAVRDVPAQRQAPLRHRQRAVFACIGRQFVDNEREREVGMWLQLHRAAGHDDLPRL